MRTNIEIDDDLMAAALKTGEFRTKKEAVEAALRLMVRVRQQEQLTQLRGKVRWDGDLDAMRAD